MRIAIYVIIASGLIIFLGTFVMYSIESQVPNSEIKTLLDSLWWCVSAVTTVGYGDIVPVSKLGRIVAIFYMFFGIAMISILLSVITNTFYKRRYGEKDREKREEQVNYLKNQLMERLSEIEQKQEKCIDLINHLR
jgi:voltage-gated potassium channel